MLTDFFNNSKVVTIATNKLDSYSHVKEFASTYKKNIIEMEQVHGNSFQFLSKKSPQTKIPQVDGILTNNPNLLLTVRTADCLPILLYHPSAIVGALHAGRKSTEQQLLAKILTFMKNEKSISNDISLWFGPAICEACYQIDRKTNTHYNLIAQNMQQAHSVFSPQNMHITVNGDCTQCVSQEYHSYRVEQADVQMNYFGIALI